MASRSNSTMKSRGRPVTFDPEHVIDIAMNMYWKKGIENVSLNEISKLSNESRTGIYREFKNEDGLQYAAIQRYNKLVLEPWSEAIKNSTNLPKYLEEVFKSIIYSKLRKQNLHLAYSMKIAQYKLSTKTRNAVIKLNDSIIESWKIALQTAQIEGYVSKRAEINSLAEYIQAQVILFIALSRNKMPEDKQEKIMKLVIKTVTLSH
mgnify:CR=1 FL=1